MAFPDCGPEVHRGVEAAVEAQPWPATAVRKTVSVSAPSERTISANLINAGLSHATGRYVAFLHHQDLIYHHAYTKLIGRLEESGAWRRSAGFAGPATAAGPDTGRS